MSKQAKPAPKAPLGATEPVRQLEHRLKTAVFVKQTDRVRAAENNKTGLPLKLES